MTPESKAEEIINGFKNGKTSTWTHLIHDSEIVPAIAAAIRARGLA